MSSARTSQQFGDLEQALAAFEEALGAKSVEELLDRLEQVPDWLFRRHPRRKEIAARLMPSMLGILREMAEGGSQSAAMLLTRLLELHPHLQTIFPRR